MGPALSTSTRPSPTTAAPELPAAAAVVGLAAAYALGFAPTWHLAGDAAFALVLVPAAAAGWLFGPLTGGLASAALAVLNVALYSAAAETSLHTAVAGAPLGAVLTLATGIAAGVLRVRQRALASARTELQRQLAEREALTTALQASEQRFRLLAEESLAGVYLVQDGVFQYVNPAFAAAVGYRPEEIIGHLGPEDLTLPEDRGIVREKVTERMSKGNAASRYRLRGRARDGSIIHLEVAGRALTIDGKPAILGTLRDRTREAADELRNRTGLTALEVAPTGILVTDDQGTVIWANPHAETVSGYTRDELIGTSARELGLGAQDAALTRSLWRTVQAGKTWRGRLTSHRKDGSEYISDVAVTSVGGDADAPRRYVAALMDITESVKAKERIEELNAELRQRVARLETLHHIDAVITAGDELEPSLQPYVAAVRSGLGLDAVSVFLLTNDGEHLELRATEGYRTPTPSHLAVPLNAGVAGAAAGRRQPIVTQGRQAILDSVEPAKRAMLAAEGFEVFAAVPMIARGQLRGVLEAGNRQPLGRGRELLGSLRELAVQGAILIDHAALLSDLRHSNEALRATYDATIEGWSRTLDLRDKETEGHSRRVTELSLALGHRLGLDEDALTNLRRGALLHDIGKMGVPDAILQKPGSLTNEEWTIMERHTTFARDLLWPITFLRPALDVPYSHHEKWDGSGYPEGLAGKDIPLPARIFAVADVYDALTSDRPYRPAWDRSRALEHIRKQAGKHFDPAVVDAFLSLMQQPPRRDVPALARFTERPAPQELP